MSRKIIGIIVFIIGLFIIWSTLDEAIDAWSALWGLFWSLLISGAGIYIFFNKKEDTIEEIKNSKKIKK